MKIRAQIGMVLNLDKCIGCHTCSVTCKNVWTNREGMEYAWFNNVETKPGIGYPRSGRTRTAERRVGEEGRRHRAAAGRQVVDPDEDLRQPELPEIDDYYEPFTFDYEHLHTAPVMKAAPVARPRSLITGSAWRRSSGARTGRRSSAASSPSARRTPISRACRRTSTASSRTRS